MKLYYSPGACSLSPHIALLEAGLPHDLVKVDLRAKKLENGDDFLKVNPKGQVPALALDSGELVTEGPVIVQMIADKAAGKNLAPQRVRQLLPWHDAAAPNDEQRERQATVVAAELRPIAQVPIDLHRQRVEQVHEQSHDAPRNSRPPGP